jgi:two-component system NtrC family sensor kinase
MTIDIVIIGLIVVLVIALFLLSHKEIRTSLDKIRSSEQDLEKEKEILLGRLENQREEMKRFRTERMNELSKVAEFGRLSQGLFHDLMTPLTSVILHTEKLKEVPPSETAAVHKNLEKAIDASRRMAAYIQNIRTSMQNEQADHEFDLGEELNNVIELFSFRSKTETVQIKSRISSRLVYYGDPIKLRQVFSNLISNALDSCNEKRVGKKEVAISLTTKDSRIVFSVRDTGNGISPSHLEKIFSPFFTTKSPDRGTGIGLSTVKSIVENDLKGAIAVESEVEKGSLFTISFPEKSAKH